jgi:hypothetical protein
MPLSHAGHWAGIIVGVAPVVALGVWMLVLRRRGEKPGRRP